MATIKAYTDLEQSKKLAEILSLESADMHYNVVGDAIIGDYQSGISNARSVAKAYKKNPDEFTKKVIPCWSLAALLDVLPYPSLHKTFAGWRCDSYDKEGKACWLGESADNQIDACYELILKLHELNLL